MNFLQFSLPTLATMLICTAAYAFTSTFFYYFPDFLPFRHNIVDTKKKRHNFVVVSHRGGSGENNENTMPAFIHSKAINVDAIELDCQLTKDGQVVVSHDNSLLRIAGVDKLISDLNYNELPEILEDHIEDVLLNKNLKRVVSTSFITNALHSRKGADHSSESRRIPLLEEVFQECDRILINLDIKLNNDELILKVHDLILRYKREQITVWGSFHEEVNQKCHKLNPKIGLYFSAKGCWKLFLLITTGLLPFWPLKETHLEVIMPNELLKNKSKTMPWATLLPLLLVKFILVRKSMVRHLKKRGIQVYFWVLNTDDEFRKAIDVGVDGIITDFPSKLIEFCNEDPVYKKIIVRPE